jgi:hypothetical protein
LENRLPLSFIGSVPDYFNRHADDNKKWKKPNQQRKRKVKPSVGFKAKKNAQADSCQKLHTHSGIFYQFAVGFFSAFQNLYFNFFHRNFTKQPMLLKINGRLHLMAY